MTCIADQNVRCPACAATLSMTVIVSTYTLWAHYYTDGYVSESGRDDEYVVCQACGAGLWWREHAFGELIYEDESICDPSDTRSRALGPEDEMYPEFIRNPVWRNYEEELYIRMRAWWAWNNPYRPSRNSIMLARMVGRDPFPPAIWPDEVYDNCRRLHECLSDTDDATILLRAELHRECKEFAACIAMLNRSFQGRYEHFARFIEGLAQKGKHTITMFPERAKDRVPTDEGDFYCEMWAEEPIPGIDK
jgi:hypothetical protein